MFQSQQAGLVYVVEPSHGYHRQSIHLATKFPDILNEVNNPINIFPKAVWLATLMCYFLIILMVNNITIVYSKVNPQMVRKQLAASRIFLRLLTGFTEPDDEGWFKGYSTGANCHKYCNTIWDNSTFLGRFLMSLWFIFSFFIISFYCMDLRADIMVPEMEKPIETLQDIDFGASNIIIDFEEAAKMLLKDQALLSHRVPVYSKLSEKSAINVSFGEKLPFERNL